MGDKVRYEVVDRVAVISLDRPDKLNAMDADVFMLLTEHARRAQADPSVRSVVVRGEGRSFSSGLDVSLFAQGAAANGDLRIDIEALQRAFSAYEDLTKPTIAAVKGHCWGGGFQLAIACDLRIASADAALALAEVRWAIIPDLGGTQRLPRLIGLGRAKELILTGRSVDAAEAHAWGLVNEVVEPGNLDEEAMVLAARLAAGPPLALAAAKRLAAGALDRPVSTGLEREAEAQRTLLVSQDFREAVQASLERRSPDFQAR